MKKKWYPFINIQIRTLEINFHLSNGSISKCLSKFFLHVRVIFANFQKQNVWQMPMQVRGHKA